ncbi:hypothetical protein HDA31_000301 [Micromonospora carbonacea subsp. aurantiaca]|nr:hypothetical protein [Micromonospora carbonacea]
MTRLRPGRSGRSWSEVIGCEDRADRDDDRPVRIGDRRAVPWPARAGAAFLAGAVRRAEAEAEAALAARVGVAVARARPWAVVRVGDAVARARPWAARAGDGAALARPGAAFALVGAGAAFARAGVALVRALAAVRVPPVVLVLVALARPAGPVLRRAAPRPSARRVRARVFTSSGLRSTEIPATPRRRSWARMSSTRIREISDSEIVGVFGVWLPACRLVLVAVPPRPELFR